jgi:hypothetical protein
MDATHLAAPIHAGPGLRSVRRGLCATTDQAGVLAVVVRKGVTMDGLMGKLVLWLGTLGLVVGFVLAAFFLVPGPMVKMTWRR